MIVFDHTWEPLLGWDLRVIKKVERCQPSRIAKKSPATRTCAENATKWWEDTIGLCCNLHPYLIFSWTVDVNANGGCSPY